LTGNSPQLTFALVEENALEGGGDKRGIVLERVYAVLRSLISGLLLFVGLVWFIGSVHSELGPLKGWILALLGLWLALFVHELGHASAAIVCGWKVAVFVVGPMGFHIHNRQLAYVPRSKRLERAGFVVSFPSSPAVWTRARTAAFIAGGPVASLILIALSAIVIITSRTSVPPIGINPSMAAAGLALFSAWVAFATLTPMPRGKGQSDVQNFLHIVRLDERDWRKTRGLLRLYGLVQHKVRLRELPCWMLEDARAATRGTELQRGLDALVIGALLDSHPVDKRSARQMIDAYRREHGDNSWLAFCDAYFRAVWERDPVLARARLQDGTFGDQLKPLALAAEASVVALEGDHATATLLLSQMREAAARESAFADLTFRDIGRKIEELIESRRQLRSHGGAVT
jgi:hypothetical protein